MFELIVFIIIICVIANKSSKKAEEANKSKASTSVYQEYAQTNTARSTYNNTNRSTCNNTNRNTYSNPTQGEAAWQKAARENIEKAKRRAMEIKGQLELELEGELSGYRTANLKKEGVASPEHDEMSAEERIRVRRMEERNTSILDRAKGNLTEQKEDVTLNTMEAEHNHSERVAPAIHHHPEDVLSESTLGTVEDLIVKGYEGSLCFERDFVGEAMDMINRFTVPSEV